MARVRIGELLMRQGRLDEFQLRSALAHQRQFGGRLGRAIVSLGFVPEPAFMQVLGEQLGTPVMSIGDLQVPPDVLRLVPERLVRSRTALPIARLTESRRGPLVVAVADPGDLGLLDEIAFASGLQVKPVLAAEDDLRQAIDRLFGGGAPRPARREAIELPEDTSPLAPLRRAGKHTFH